MSMIQRKLGAEILTFPSAFTVTTGLAHWEALLRARAIGKYFLLSIMLNFVNHEPVLYYFYAYFVSKVKNKGDQRIDKAFQKQIL